MDLAGPSRTTPLPAVLPHGRGELRLPALDWRAGDTVLIQFFQGRWFVDEEFISLGVPPPPKVQSSDRNSVHWTVERRPDGWRVSAGGLECFLSRRTGLVEAARPGGQAPFLSGPYSYLRILEAQEAWNRYKFFETDPRTWRLEKVDLEVKGEAIEVRTAGRINGFPVRLRQILGARGAWDIDYELATASSPPTTASAGRPMGIGLSFDLDGAAWVEWQRRGLWSSYPEGHIGRLTGGVPLGPGAPQIYREEQTGGWQTDVWDFLPSRRAPRPETPRCLRTMRGASRKTSPGLTVGFEDGAGALSVLADGDQAARLTGADGRRLRLIVLNAWDYPDIDWGNHSRPFAIADHTRGRVRLRIDQGRSPKPGAGRALPWDARAQEPGACRPATKTEDKETNRPVLSRPIRPK